ncbi:hypothetical protein [Actinophytocola sp.]|uniref:hypothetical protein n=1 Tax=Actinophytocola sp. TaxID=1872138 RepID=UPI002D61C2A6|nr:hypothetical protein [Actinophytocola sp.]HYQ68933.1 hypothetical protein [Actinophytocola sp.]
MLEFIGDPSWVFELVSTDGRVRGRALARHQSLIKAALEANHWMNRVWAQAGTPAPEEPHLAAEMEQARAAHRHYMGQTILGLLSGFWDRNPQIREQHAQFALLYLTWERRHPADWRAQASNAWSPWARKEDLLLGMAKDGIPAAVRPQMSDLIIDLVQHPYRCKDWLYAPLTRQLRNEEFNWRLRNLLAATDPMVRLRVEFLLCVADNPTLKIKRQTFAHWLANDRTIPVREATSPGPASWMQWSGRGRP